MLLRFLQFENARFPDIGFDNWHIVYNVMPHRDVPCSLKEVAMHDRGHMRKKTARVRRWRMNETVGIAGPIDCAPAISARWCSRMSVRTEGNTCGRMFTERDVVRAIAEHGCAAST